MSGMCGEIVAMNGIVNRLLSKSRCATLKDWQAGDVMGACECGHDRDDHEGGVTYCHLCSCADYRVVHDGVEEKAGRKLSDIQEHSRLLDIWLSARKRGQNENLHGDRDNPYYPGNEYDTWKAGVSQRVFPFEYVPSKKDFTSTLRSAGQWLAGKWAALEERYGRKTALAMAVGMLATFPVPGNIPAIIGIAEGIRGIHGYFQSAYGGDVEKLKSKEPDQLALKATDAWVLEVRASARNAYRKLLQFIRANKGQVHATVRQETADNGILAGIPRDKVRYEMEVAGVSFEDASMATLLSRQKPYKMKARGPVNRLKAPDNRPAIPDDQALK